MARTAGGTNPPSPLTILSWCLALRVSPCSQAGWLSGALALTRSEKLKVQPARQRMTATAPLVPAFLRSGPAVERAVEAAQAAMRPSALRAWSESLS